MSLEVALQENTKAVLALAALLSAKGFGQGGVTETPPPAPPAKPADAKPEPKKEEKAPAPNAPAGELNYERDIKGWALAIAKKDRAKLTGIWETLKVKVGAELKPEQFAQAKSLIDAACKELGITEPAKAGTK